MDVIEENTIFYSFVILPIADYLTNTINPTDNANHGLELIRKVLDSEDVTQEQIEQLKESLAVTVRLLKESENSDFNVAATRVERLYPEIEEKFLKIVQADTFKKLKDK